MPVRFYVDADLLGVAKILTSVRADVTYPGDPGGPGVDGLPRAPCSIQPGDKDTDWIPQVASNGWVTITRDRRIQSRPAERQAVIANGARVLALDARRQLRKWDQLEIIVRQWGKFEELSELAGPWIYRATRSGCTKVL
jgi:hypothetical protein